MIIMQPLTFLSIIVSLICAAVIMCLIASGTESDEEKGERDSAIHLTFAFLFLIIVFCGFMFVGIGFWFVNW